MLFHGGSTLPYGYGADTATTTTMDAATSQQLIQAGITGGSEIAAALISAFGTQAMIKQQQEYALQQQRATYQQERALAKLQGGGYLPVSTAAAPPAAASGGMDTTTLLLIAGLGLAAFLILRKKD